MLKTAVLLNILGKTKHTYFQDSLMNNKFKRTT